jgi:hypothetical protein
MTWFSLLEIIAPQSAHYPVIFLDIALRFFSKKTRRHPINFTFGDILMVSGVTKLDIIQEICSTQMQLVWLNIQPKTI